MRRMFLAVVALAATALLLVFAVGALADGGHGRHGDDNGRGNGGRSLFESTIVPNLPTDPAIHGVSPAGAAWMIKRGEVRISSGGGFRVEVRGLVLQSTGANPIPSLTAVLFCGVDTTPAASSGPVPFSTAGNADVRTNVTLPAKCIAPVVLLEISPSAGQVRWIGASGLSG